MAGRLARYRWWAAPGPAQSWTGGFGPSVSPYSANIAEVSYALCRRRLLACLRQHRRSLASNPAARAAFEAAEAELAALAPGAAWCHRVCVDQFDLTFWLLESEDAHRHGASTKPRHLWALPAD